MGGAHRASSESGLDQPPIGAEMEAYCDQTAAAGNQFFCKSGKEVK